jgi:hypothetical protein
MTIALGAICAGGLIVAADTNVVLDDGSRSETMKVDTVLGPTGSYVIANATTDGNAAKTLVNHLKADLKKNDLREPGIDPLDVLEGMIADRMTRWANDFVKPPSVQLILGAFVNEHEPDDISTIGGGVALYFCEPPNTVLRKLEIGDDIGYVAIGSGAAITDPLFKTLFPITIKSPRTRLIEVSYLMYKAKKHNAMCAGKTTAVFLKAEHSEAIRINPLSMASAEELGGRLDFLLLGTGTAVTSMSEAAVRDYVTAFGNIVVTLGNNFRELKIISLSGEEIT